MVEIKLTNTRTRSKERFTPIDPQNVRMYLCGPTVYDRAHLGNARPVVVFDVLYRLLRHVYGNDHVTYVRNFTDVDDKINASALARQQSGDPRPLEELIRERTEETIGWYHADMDALGALRPDHEPRATDYIPQMIAMIEALIAKGHAYAAEGHVLFDVRSFPAYGRLSGRSVDDMIAGARVEVAPFKRDPMDFVLWKPSSDEEPGWASPWGRGRPGWHIECSAMSAALLGESFDIHGGGIDLQFPHHENEIAQSCCAHPREDFARVWLHNEMLQVEGKKMSKSLGNFFTVRDLLDQGIPGEVIRYVFLMTHYRDVMDYSTEKVHEAKTFFSKVDAQQRTTVSEITAIGSRYSWREAKEWFNTSDVMLALCDDLNTPRALNYLHELAVKNDPASVVRLGYCLDFLGLTKSFKRVRSNFRRGLTLLLNSIDDARSLGSDVVDLVASENSNESDKWQIALRYLAEHLPDMKAREELSNLYEMSANTSFQSIATTLDRITSDILMAKINLRSLAKKDGDYSYADQIRNDLQEKGVEIIDTPLGPRWRVTKKK